MESLTRNMNNDSIKNRKFNNLSHIDFNSPINDINRDIPYVSPNDSHYFPSPIPSTTPSNNIIKKTVEININNLIINAKKLRIAKSRCSIQIKDNDRMKCSGLMSPVNLEPLRTSSLGPAMFRDKTKNFRVTALVSQMRAGSSM